MLICLLNARFLTAYISSPFYYDLHKSQCINRHSTQKSSNISTLIAITTQIVYLRMPIIRKISGTSTPWSSYSLIHIGILFCGYVYRFIFLRNYKLYILPFSNFPRQTSAQNFHPKHSNLFISYVFDIVTCNDPPKTI